MDAMDYIKPGEYLNSRRFGAFPVHSRVTRATIGGRHQLIVCGVSNKLMELWKSQQLTGRKYYRTCFFCRIVMNGLASKCFELLLAIISN